MILAYHGAKMQDSIAMMKKKYSNKFTYRSTEKDEALGYAKISKYDDKNNNGAILEARIDDKNVKNIAIKDRENFYGNENTFLGEKTGILDLGKFKVIITPPKRKFENAKIVEII